MGRELESIVWLGRASFDTVSNIGREDVVNLLLVGLNLNLALCR